MTERENREIYSDLTLKNRESLKDWLAHANSDWSLTEGVGYASLMHVTAWLQHSANPPPTLPQHCMENFWNRAKLTNLSTLQ